MKRVKKKDKINVEKKVEAKSSVVWAKLNSLNKTTSRNYQIKSQSLGIGRLPRPHNNFQIDDARLASKHALLTRSFDADGNMVVSLTDMSTTGTYLNNKKVSARISYNFV